MWLVVLALLGLVSPPTHPDSKSSSRIVVAGRSVQVELACQALSLLESVPLDRNGDRWLTDDELQAGRAAVGEYVLARDALSASAAPFEDLRGELRELTLVDVAPGAFGEQRVVCSLAFEAPAKLERLSVRVQLFHENNPLHRDVATLVWNDEPPTGFLFGEGALVWEFEPLAERRVSTLASYVRLGVEHIGGGWDHLAFLLGLLVAAKGLRSLLIVVTSFTLSHSLTLAAASLGWVDVPSRLVELAIALSIAYVGAEALLVRRPASRGFEAFGFGLIHGLGFAGFLGESLLAEPLKFEALLGFNLGVELGQLAAVLCAALLLRFLPGDRSFEGDPRGWFAPRWLRFSGAGLALLTGLYWFLERAGWLPWS
jgi:hypothetical protein